MGRPRLNQEGQKELNKVEDQIQGFSDQVSSMTLDTMNQKPVEQVEPQTKISNREAKKTDAPYIKPVRAINSKEPFNEKYRADHTYGWEYVRVIVENHEIIGEDVETWTKSFAGDPAHFWKIPTNRAIMIPRLLAKQLSQCKYHRLRMDQQQMAGSDGMGTYMGSMIVDQTKERISCHSVNDGFAAMGL